MFDDRAFRSWPRILTGGLGFAALFALVVLLAGALTSDGSLHLSRRVARFGTGAFAGYVGIACLVRLRARRDAG